MSAPRSGLGLVLPFAVMAALVFGLTAWLYLYRLEHTLTQVEDSRLRFTLQDLRADFEKSLDRGLALRELPGAQAAIEAEARQDGDVLSLTVLDASGRAAWHTGRAAPAMHLPRSESIQRDAAAITAVTPLLAMDGTVAGALVLRYSDQPHARTVLALTLRLAAAALAATTITSAIFAVALRRLLRRRDHLLGQAGQALGTHRAGPDTPPEVAELVDKVNQTASTALVEVTAARHALSEQERAG